jgi:hypothetical protein
MADDPVDGREGRMSVEQETLEADILKLRDKVTVQQMVPLAERSVQQQYELACDLYALTQHLAVKEDLDGAREMAESMLEASALLLQVEEVEQFRVLFAVVLQLKASLTEDAGVALKLLDSALSALSTTTQEAPDLWLDLLSARVDRVREFDGADAALAAQRSVVSMIFKSVESDTPDGCKFTWIHLMRSAATLAATSRDLGLVDEAKTAARVAARSWHGRLTEKSAVEAEVGVGVMFALAYDFTRTDQFDVALSLMDEIVALQRQAPPYRAGSAKLAPSSARRLDEQYETLYDEVFAVSDAVVHLRRAVATNESAKPTLQRWLLRLADAFAKCENRLLVGVKWQKEAEKLRQEARSLETE